MGFEAPDLREGGVEVAAEANGAIIEINVRRRLPVGHFGDEPPQTMLDEPLLDVLFPADGENDNAIALLDERSQKFFGPGTRRMKIARALPTVEKVEDAVEIDADNQRVRHGPMRRSARRTRRAHSALVTPQL